MDIKKLIDQYDKKIVMMQKKIEEFKQKKNVLQDILKDADELFDDNTISSIKETPSNNITVVSNKYTNMYWPEAILSVLKDGKEMTAKEVLDELLKNGFQTTSKSMESDVYGRLGGLVEKGDIIAVKDGKQLKKYKIKQEDVEKENGSDSTYGYQSR